MHLARKVGYLLSYQVFTFMVCYLKRFKLCRLTKANNVKAGVLLKHIAYGVQLTTRVHYVLHHLQQRNGSVCGCGAMERLCSGLRRKYL